MPVQARSDEGCLVERVRDLFDFVKESRELATAPISDCLGEIALEVGKVEESGTRCPFLAHKQQWYLRAEQQDRLASLNSFGCGDPRQPLAERTIADLIVVLQEVDKG